MTSSNKSIARNTLLLYGRKILTLAIALYTSRLLLERLGVTDFGIYGLVGSIVAMFSALRGIFSSSIQRFINIAKGGGVSTNVNQIFSMGLKIHFGIAVLFLVIGEVGGSIMLYFLKIPSGAVLNANIVLQFSILTAITSILTVPYDAIIIANERFDAYAIFSIIDFSLRLFVVVLLALFSTNRLAIYAGLLFVSALLVRFINMYYCKHNFRDEVKYHKVKNKRLLKEMTTFAGWQFLGNTAYTLTNNGINFILNLMGGVVVNAARTIAYQAMSAISQFISDLNLSFQPRTMMRYAQGNLSEFIKLIYLNTKANYAIAIVLAFPVFILTRPILTLWLGEVPQYAVSFVKALMIYLVIRSIHAPIDLYFKSYGKIKQYQITELIVLSLSLPLSWLVLRLHYPYYMVFIVMAIVEGMNIVALLILARIQYGFDILFYFRKVLFRIICSFILISVTSIYINRWFHFDSLSIIGVCMACLILFLITSIIIILTLFPHREIIRILQLAKLKRK